MFDLNIELLYQRFILTIFLCQTKNCHSMIFHRWLFTGWCSLFNADLALSVSMTGISTLLSIVMLPLNLVIYTWSSYSNEVVKSLDWFALFLSLIVVLGGITSGVLTSAWYNSTRFNLMANKLGNLAGLALVIFSAAISNSNDGDGVWNQDATFYIGCALPGT